ncbi:MAG: peptidylprolyl isomerase [Phycisphaerales bacterium]
MRETGDSMFGRRMWCVALGGCALAMASPMAFAQPRVTSITVDNRGRIVLEFDRAMQPIGFQNNQAIQVRGAGADGISGTADDRTVSVDAELDFDTRRTLIVDADTDPDERYSFLLRSAFALDMQGNELDGEFNGQDEQTGDGAVGGDLEFFTRPPEGNPIARFETVAGRIDVELFADQTPLTVENFFDYANSGVWDETFVHRLADGFVWQGGGFNSRTFNAIPDNAPVLNEPGVSNVRGTIAMAKLGGQPNSATNEWFFNLANNSANLDFQNGGFTAFGKILGSSGLAVMDEIAEFPTIDATSVNGAFGDLPVLDDEKFLDDEGLPVPDPEVSSTDLISISRISILYEAIDRPFETIEESQSFTISAPGGGSARVTLFNLDGGTITLPDSIVDVVFAGGSAIASVTFREPFSPNRIGVQITGASSVGLIRDLRAPGNDRLAFVLCDAPVNAVMLNSLSGANINQTRLPDGTILPPDIDGDGRSDDPTALVLSGGVPANQVLVQGALTGSVIAEDGVRFVRVVGQTMDCSFVVGGVTNYQPRFQLGRVRDANIVAPDHVIGQVLATEWVGLPNQRIDARGILALRTTGLVAMGVPGDFQASLSLSGAPNGAMALGSALISGEVRDSSWDVIGPVGQISIRTAASQWNLFVGGSLNLLIAGRLGGTDVTVTGLAQQIVVGEWNAGTVQLNRVGTMVVRPDPSVQATGTFEANMLFSGSATQPFAIGSLAFRGPVRNANINLPFSHAAQAVIFTDEIFNSSFTLNGRITTLRATNVVRDTSMTVSQPGVLLFGRWDGGSLNTGNNTITLLQTLGVGTQPGDFLADITARGIDSMRLGRGGSYRGVMDVDLPRDLIIEGDVTDSLLRLGANNFRGSFVSERIAVTGEIRTTRIQSIGALGIVRARSLVDSQIITGSPNVANNAQSLPDSNPGLFGIDRINTVLIDGLGSRFERSLVIAGSIGSLTTANVQTSNAGTPFGIAAGEIGAFKVTTNTGIARSFLPPLSGPRMWGDFQVRTGFQIPTEQSP